MDSLTGDSKLDDLLGVAAALEKEGVKTRGRVSEMSTKDMREAVARLTQRKQEVWEKIRRRKVDLQARKNGHRIMRPSSETGLRRPRWG